MQRTLEGKKALITGGSRGIGRAIALEFAANGAEVAIGYVKNVSSVQEVVNTIGNTGGKAVAVQADLSRLNEITRLFDEAENAMGALDIVVASAANILVKPLTECSEEDYNHIFDMNVRSIFFILKEAALRLNNNGRIIVLSTGGTKMFFPGQSLYLGSKGAVEQFVRTLAWELGERGITVNAISPGPTETDMMQERYRAKAASLSPFDRIGDPKEIADAAVFLASEAARWVTAQNIGVGGGAF